jgi:heparan-alpha-glucosaminide N-acetyltransferase
MQSRLGLARDAWTRGVLRLVCGQPRSVDGVLLARIAPGRKFAFNRRPTRVWMRQFPVTTTEPPLKTPPGRLTSLDAYRGFVMFLMMAEVLRCCRVASALPESGLWKWLCHHQSHVEWIGCSLHDLIQPSFSFMVGVALPFSLASRSAKGQSSARMTVHAFWRALLLILLGVFLRSTGSPQTYWTFEDTLSQIGLGYGALFLLGFRPARDQWIALAVILVGYWAAFALYSAPADFDYAKVGVSKDWPHLMTGFAAHWNKNSNLAWAFDTWFLNLFSREKPFEFNGGGYATLSFIPTLGTMILGLIAGGIIRGERSPLAKVKWLLAAGILGLVAGAVIGWLELCPVVKRIWTPSWTLYSGGWCFLLLAGLYLIIDIMGFKFWAFPLVVIGMNSIGAYCIAHLFEGFIIKNLTTHLGQNTFKIFGDPYGPFVHGAAVLLVFWLILFWMYRRKIFLRI